MVYRRRKRRHTVNAFCQHTGKFDRKESQSTRESPSVLHHTNTSLYVLKIIRNVKSITLLCESKYSPFKGNKRRIQLIQSILELSKEELVIKN